MGKTTAGLVLLLATAGWAQTTFEVASVRRAREGGYRGPFDSIQVSPGSLTMRGVRFRKAIAWAYGVSDFQVNGPDWLDQIGFEIVAKAGDKVNEDELRLMLRALLAERLKLAVHQEDKETQAYVLTVGKGIPAFITKSNEEGDPLIQPNPSKMEVVVKRAPVSSLVELLSKVLREPVINETGLNGKYDATVNFAKYIPDGSTSPDIASLAVRFVQQEFGLKVEHRKTLMHFVVVDRAEKEPVEN